MVEGESEQERHIQQNNCTVQVFKVSVNANIVKATNTKY